MTPYDLITERRQCYDLQGFKPIAINHAKLRELDINYPIADEDLAQLAAGSQQFVRLFANRSLTPLKCYEEALAAPEEELEIHNYTGLCPTNVLEVTPSTGSCACACQYCLVTDGNHIARITVFTNYAEKLRKSLERNSQRELFYYFSAKTEAFSEPHLRNGLAHDILRAFISHYQERPESKVRVFIASKAGLPHLLTRHNGDSVLKLLSELRGKLQYNGSIGIMPAHLREVLEPNVATMEERLEVLQVCQAMGICAESVLCQPLILVYLTPESVETYLKQLAAAGVRNIKPEFLTAEVKNLALVAQFVNHHNPQLLRDFLYPYLREDNRAHLKQRLRRAPDRAACVEKLALIRQIAGNYGITISMCNWVEQELSRQAAWVSNVDAASHAGGWRCLGYQMRLFPSWRQQ